MKYLICYDGSAFAKEAIDFVIKTVKKDEEFVLFGAIEEHTSAYVHVGKDLPSEFHSLARKTREKLYKKQVDARKQLVDGGFDKDKIHILL